MENRKYISAALTDVGLRKKINQDSVCVKIADTDRYGQIAMAVICDGMGGLSMGELASATVIRSFSDWFEKVLPRKLPVFSWDEVAKEWQRLVYKQNGKIFRYGEKHDLKLGTTLSAILLFQNKYMCIHVGDSRIYRISEDAVQITNDHTLVAREVREGKLNKEEARTDDRRNILLQCIGFSRNLSPDMFYGDVEKDYVFMLCSDGLYHTFDEETMRRAISPKEMNNIGDMHRVGKTMIEEAKACGERDNITIVLMKCL